MASAIKVLNHTREPETGVLVPEFSRLRAQRAAKVLSGPLGDAAWRVGTTFQPAKPAKLGTETAPASGTGFENFTTGPREKVYIQNEKLTQQYVVRAESEAT